MHQEIKYDSFEIVIFRELGNNTDGVNIYDLHKEYLLSPGQIIAFISKFEKLDLIKFIDFKISLLEKGKTWLIENRKDLFLNSRDKYWMGVPDYFLDENSEQDDYSVFFLLNERQKQNFQKLYG